MLRSCSELGTGRALKNRTSMAQPHKEMLIKTNHCGVTCIAERTPWPRSDTRWSAMDRAMELWTVGTKTLEYNSRSSLKREINACNDNEIDFVLLNEVLA